MEPKLYLFVVDCYYAPLGDHHYPAGIVDALTDWSSESIKSALAAGIIAEAPKSAAEELAVVQEDDKWQKSPPEMHVSYLEDTTSQGNRITRH